MYFRISNFIVITIFIQMVNSQVTLSSESGPFFCTRSTKLKCQYNGASACCTSVTRTWRKNGTQIMNDGTEISLKGKYSEIVDSTAKQFELEIKDLENSDFGAKYSCEYGFDTSSDLVLNIESLLCPHCYVCASRCLAWGILGLLVSLTLTTFIIIPKLGIERRMSVLIGVISLVVCLILIITIAFTAGYIYCICFESYLDDGEFQDPYFLFFAILPMFNIGYVLLCMFKECWIEEYKLRTTLYFLTIGILYVYDKCEDGKASVGSSVELKGPYKADDKTKKLTWYKIVDGKAVRYSEEEDIHPKLSPDLMSRLKVTGDHKDGEYHLSISNVQENDKGTYQCSLSDTPGAVYRLKLTVAGGKNEAAAV